MVCNWTIEEIADWHQQTFPDATLESQLLKLDEELQEYLAAMTKEDEIKEHADIYIVACSLKKRFGSVIGDYFLNECGNSQELMDAVNNKMAINLNRMWIVENGVYRHAVV